MGKTLLYSKLLLTIAFTVIGILSASGQITSPGRDWEGLTEYSKPALFSENFNQMNTGILSSPWLDVEGSSRWRIISSADTSNSSPKSLVIKKHPTLAKNDWVFTPKKTYLTGIIYSLTFYLKAPGTSEEPEKLEVRLGTEQSIVAMTTSIFKKEDIRLTSWTKQEITFTVPSDGEYSFGFYAYSAANVDYIAIDDIVTKATSNHPVYVFFSTAQNPKLGSLLATFSDNSLSTFKWYKYNNSIQPISNRFELFYTDTNVESSALTGLNSGGYKVELTRLSDNSKEVYTVWLFIDSVMFSEIYVDNKCDFMFLEALSVPDRNTVFYEFFSYYDLSTSMHSIINKIGSNYFKTINWTAGDTHIQMPLTSSLSIVIQDPAPLYNSTYTINLTNPFGRVLTFTSPEIIAKATKADFDLFIYKEYDLIPDWQNGGETPKGEALLEIKLESKSLNADSIFWNILNDELSFARGADSIIWRYKETMITESVEAFPPKILMVPGKYKYEHIALNFVSGCRDTVYKTVVVDSSFIKADAIPNVFTPNGDGANDFFLLKDSDLNLKSIMQFSISIYSRWGRRMHTYIGDPKEWEGWDGKVDGSNGDAPDGVYYYIIEATGWDGRKFKGGVYKGFLHLYRGR